MTNHQLRRQAEQLTELLFDQIKHGDAEHQAWLRNHLDQFNDVVEAFLVSNWANAKTEAMLEAIQAIKRYPDE